MQVTAELVRDTFRVREPCGVQLIVRCSDALRPGDTLEVQFPNSWCLVTGPSYTRQLQTEDAAGEHFVAVRAPGTDAHFSVEIRPRHLLCPRAPARHGRLIIARLQEGQVPAGSPVLICYANTYAPYVAETERIWVRLNGQPPLSEPELKVMAGPGERLRVIAPSAAQPGVPFDVLIVSLDAFDNASSTSYADGVLTLTDGTLVRRHISFVGHVRLPVVIHRPGVYRLQFNDAVSNPVHVAEGSQGPYWGDIHIHTKISHDGQGTEPYAYAHQVSGLDFAAVADHCVSHGQQGYDLLLRWAREAYQPGRFVTILADERDPRQLGSPGHYNVYFRDEQTFLELVGRPGEATHLPIIGTRAAAAIDPARVMFIPHHTGICFGPWKPGRPGSRVEWDRWPGPEGLRPLVEIYSHHGQSELYAPEHPLSYELNRMRRPERRANTSIPGPYYVRDYWAAGHRVGVIASSDEHSGQGGRQHGGLAAVWAPELTREAIFDALRQRRCYATTGERMLMLFSANGVPMGGEATARDRVKLRLDVWATDLLLRVEIFRCRFGDDEGFVPILSDAPRPETMDVSYCLEDDFQGPCMYYARVTQQPVTRPDIAWSSPVWVDSA